MNQYYMVSGDIEYTAQTCMIEDSWETIISDVQEGELSKYQVGCRKSIEMDINNDGANETYTLRVANNTIPSVCSSSTYSQTACGFVLEFVDIVTSRAMGEGGWETSTARTYINGTVYNALPSGLKKESFIQR
ncbi:MAG: hypothetical protein IJI60_02850 [Bacilli bacterium]|nr:hypothetical protein [Bacilli bacterium]